MENFSAIDLSRHCSVTASAQIGKIIAPLSSAFRIKHFRYLKLYNNGARVLLSNYADCTRFIYELGHYKKMWFDGEFPEHLTEGWHIWDVTRTIKSGNEISSFEKEINNVLGLYHGITFVQKDTEFHEIYTFDTDHTDIYLVDYKLLRRFMLYFKEQARKLIDRGEEEKIIIRSERTLSEQAAYPNKDSISDFLENTRISRYYLSGKYSGVYLTSKEAQCVYWLVQGKSAEEIAMIENITKRTSENHLDNVRRKLNCSKQTQIVRILLETGFLEHIDFFQ